MSEHSPLPWLAQGLVVTTDDGDKLIVVASYRTHSVDEARANARLIVRAVNNHDELLAALKAALPVIEDCAQGVPELADRMYAAIAKAEGREEPTHA